MVVGLFVLFNFLPEVIDVDDELRLVVLVVVHHIVAGRARERPQRGDRLPALDVLVVSVVLRERLLEECGPERFVFADVREPGSVGAVLPLVQRQVVVDDDRVGDAERVQIDTVDAGLVEGVVRVEEHFLDGALLFGQRVKG